MKTISFEQLAEKLNGKLWIKGDLKRIYLDEGYNTKKMSTKTFVEETEGGYVVKCFIECPSQGWNWIKSQQEEVIERVETQIDHIIKRSTLELVDYKIIEDKAEVLVKANAESDSVWFMESDFNEEFGDYPADVFGGKLAEELEAIYEKKREANRMPVEEINAHNLLIKTSAINEIFTKGVTESIEFGVDSKVKHSNFGIGVVTNETNEKITIDFPSIGEKSLIKRFAKLTLVNG